MPAKPAFDQADRSHSTTVPTALLQPEFGKIYLWRDTGRTHVEFTIRLTELEGEQAEQWQTGIALDASASMKDWYGRNLTGKLPASVLDEYERKGWVVTTVEDGCPVKRFKKEAYEDAIRVGHLMMTPNVVEPLARDFIAYLARELDSRGSTTVIYWACGAGDAYEVLGDVTAAQCATLTVNGPTSVTFGDGTKLVPAMRYFLERFRDAPQGMYVFLTDGKLDDLNDIKATTRKLAESIQQKKRKPVKCVLIGVGTKIDEQQMIELDDLDTGTDVDIWDHKIAQDMRDVNEIIVELVDTNKIVAPGAVVYDDRGAVAIRFSDGLPARAAFDLPAGARFFELEVLDRRIRQELP